MPHVIEDHEQCRCWVLQRNFEDAISTTSSAPVKKQDIGTNTASVSHTNKHTLRTLMSSVQLEEKLMDVQ